MVECLKFNVVIYIPDNVVNISIALPLGMVGGISLIGCKLVSRLGIGPFWVVCIGWIFGGGWVWSNEVADIESTELGTLYFFYIV